MSCAAQRSVNNQRWTLQLTALNVRLVMFSCNGDSAQSSIGDLLYLTESIKHPMVMFLLTVFTWRLLSISDICVQLAAFKIP